MKDPQELIRRFKSRVHVLDGGLATELEKRGHDISGKLWSAQVLLEDPDAIEQLHYDYLKAGADIIITSSYQLTFQGMRAEGYSHKQAEDALWKSVEVAVKARDRYLSELDEDLPEDRKPLIAASIGPYGAYLADGSEYTGDYGMGVDDLIAFHRDRFDQVMKSEADFVAFETTPSELEVEAYFSLLSGHPAIPCWITASRWQACRAVVHQYHWNSHQPKNLVGTGANCIEPAEAFWFIHEVRLIADAIANIVYPNSGETWNAEERCWVGESDANSFCNKARDWIAEGANIIGGCCRTGPEHIAQLRALVDSLA